MSRHVSDTPYLHHEISVIEESRASYHVDVKDSKGNVLAAYTGFTEDTDALMAGKAWVNGTFYGGKHGVGAPARPRQNQHMTRLNDVLQEAAGLVSDGGENTEYDRALVELSGRLIGLDLSEESTRATVLAMLRALG